MADPVISVRNLDAFYGETQVLDDVTFDVDEGEIFVIIGASGCGKTTLLKHMAGLMQPGGGQIFHRGTEISALDEDELAEIKRQSGIAFQSGALFNSLTVGENVALPLREYGNVDEELIPAIVRMKLSLVGLSAAENKLPSELSGGMRKRAGLARAIATDPPIVYFDEPSAGLDPIMASGLDELVLGLNKLLNITFIIVTHELDSIKKIAHRVLMLDRGEVIFLGTLHEALNSDNDRVRQFFERRPDEFISARNI
jgi:phospholipid/cholesterol/gamma-HCH transport system ATP-binding protein